MIIETVAGGVLGVALAVTVALPDRARCSRRPGGC